MSWRKKIGWRGPASAPLSDSTEAVVESATAFACCACVGEPPKARKAASAPAPMPPTTKANVRIIDPVLKSGAIAFRETIHLGVKAHRTNQPSDAPKYSPRIRLHNPIGG